MAQLVVGISCRACVSFCKRLCLEGVKNGPKAANNYEIELCSRVHGCGKRADCLLCDAMFSDDGNAIFFHRGVALRKWGANGKRVREYPPQ